jgi:hypothetical protein
MYATNIKTCLIKTRTLRFRKLALQRFSPQDAAQRPPHFHRILRTTALPSLRRKYRIRGLTNKIAIYQCFICLFAGNDRLSGSLRHHPPAGIRYAPQPPPLFVAPTPALPAVHSIVLHFIQQHIYGDLPVYRRHPPVLRYCQILPRWGDGGLSAAAPAGALWYG